MAPSETVTQRRKKEIKCEQMNFKWLYIYDRHTIAI